MRQETFEVVVGISKRSRFNLFEKLVIQHANPAKLILHSLGGMWALYYMWHQLWGVALFVVTMLGVLGTALAWQSNEEELVKTSLGKFFYVCSHPANVFFQLLGYAALFYGVWDHTTQYILSGVSSILIGLLFGWNRLQDLND